MSARLEKIVLLAPDAVARAAAGRTRRPEENWLLRQPRAVRESYAREVLEASDRGRAEEIWMLGQPDEIRRSYVREVLARGSPRDAG